LRTGWLDVLTDGYRDLGLPPDRSRTLALQSLAMARGLLFEVAVTGERAAADLAMTRWTELVRHEVAEVAA
jgi:hypothetical protein